MNERLHHVFLVEDDQALANLVSEYLSQQHFRVSWEARGDRAVERILAAQPDVVLLDIMLPGKNGVDICRELRLQSDIPIIMLTARSDDIDHIVGLEVGADDYICKPVQPRLLLARITALLRRSTNNTPSNALPAEMRFGQLLINPTHQTVHLGEHELPLTTNEFTLLTQFAQHADTVLSRDDLLNHLRGFGYDGMDRTVDMLVSRLRKKLGDDANKPHKIKTVWKKGYLFVSTAWQ
ncbi:response regulator [Aestuariibacter halophilus]|uniref:Response regulator n=1 Tax=Fluctibacter halophilus TaxID=226011 RepID=A0ABS8G5N0_9ALTE|nr:response regulator [Aestuariibacter halophilus]MCC2614979.1 response regulator [Aestuariibacter halophilus]